jgi:hypothetical protein
VEVKKMSERNLVQGQRVTVELHAAQLRQVSSGELGNLQITDYDPASITLVQLLPQEGQITDKQVRWLHHFIQDYRNFAANVRTSINVLEIRAKMLAKAIEERSDTYSEKRESFKQQYSKLLAVVEKAARLYKESQSLLLVLEETQLQVENRVAGELSLEEVEERFLQVISMLEEVSAELARHESNRKSIPIDVYVGGEEQSRLVYLKNKRSELSQEQSYLTTTIHVILAILEDSGNWTTEGVYQSFPAHSLVEKIEELKSCQEQYLAIQAEVNAAIQQLKASSQAEQLSVLMQPELVQVHPDMQL